MTKATKPKRKRISPEKRAWDALVEWAEEMGYRSASGERVTPENALNLSVYFSSIRNLSEDIAKLPLVLYEKGEDDARERNTSHPLYKVLRYSPAPIYTAVTFWETLISHAAGWGNGYAEIITDGGGTVRALYLMDPRRVEPKMDRGTYYYRVLRADNTHVNIMPEAIFHLHGLGFDGLQGYSVASLAKESLGGGLATQRFAASFFGNGAHVSGVLEHPGKLTEQAVKTLRASWKKNASGDNMNAPAVLSEGMKWNRIGIPPEDAQFLETRQFQVEDICRWLRMPPHKVGHLLRAQGWSTLEQTNTDYLTDTLGSWMERICQEVQRKLLKASEQDTLFVEHLPEKLLRTDIEKRYAAYQVGVTNGWLSRNEVRQRENLNPVEGLDEFLVPLNMQTTTQAEKPSQTAEPAPPADMPGTTTDNSRALSIAVAFVPLLEQVYTRSLALEADKVKRASTKPNFETWTDDFFTAHVDHVRGLVFPIVQSYTAACESLGMKADPSTVAAEATAMATRHVEISRRQVQTATAPGQMVEMETWTTRASNEAKIDMERLSALMG